MQTHGQNSTSPTLVSEEEYRGIKRTAPPTVFEQQIDEKRRWKNRDRSNANGDGTSSRVDLNGEQSI